MLLLIGGVDGMLPGWQQRAFEEHLRAARAVVPSGEVVANTDQIASQFIAHTNYQAEQNGAMAQWVA